MNLPNFKSRDGATNYSHKGGAKIAPLVVEAGRATKHGPNSLI